MASGGAKTPFINDYKLQFFHRRFRQTLCGGLRLCIGAPYYIYLYQVVVFIWPVIIGAIFTGLTEFNILKENLSCYLYSGLMCLFVICIHVLRLLLNSSDGGKQRRHNFLAEDDDEVEFISWCDRETFEFIFPEKTYTFNILLHGILSGVLCGLSFLYLLPSTIQEAHFNTAATVVLCIFGWLTLCIANHSLTVQPPPEIATFRSLDLGLTSLMRPFYVGVITVIGILARHYQGFEDINKALQIVMVLLPLLWTVGLLPPLDALLSWVGEQVLVFVFGGTYMATDLRLLIALILSGSVLLIACFIVNYVVLITYCAVFGFILSLDLFQLTYQLVNKLLAVQVKEDKKFFHWSNMEFAKHGIVLVVCGSIAGICSHYYKDTATKNTYDIFGCVFITLTVLLKLLGDMHHVYICGGLIRNPLFAKNTTSIQELKKFQLRMRYLGQFYNVLLTYVCPLIIVVFLSTFLNTSNKDLTSFAISLGTIRALRWVWQNTLKSLFELSILCIITWCDLGNEWWNDIGIGLQLMLIGVVCSRVNDLFEKAKFMLTMFITSWTEPKQRHKATVPTLIISSALFPIVFLILIISVALSAPLAPLFCFPIFFVGFPRPKRMWPSLASQSSSSCAESVVYQQLVPKVCQAFQDSIAGGTLITLSDFILVRHQDRFIVIQVIERGYKYCTITAKGLELQETSCHTVEAATVDDIFEDIFCKERNSAFGLNRNILNTLTPSKCMIVETYSDAKNVLTGIIDYSENIERQSSNFIICLIWVLLNHLEKQKQNSSTPKNVSTENLIENEHSSSVLACSDGVIELKRETSSPVIHISSDNFTAKQKECNEDWSDVDWSDDDDTVEENSRNKESQPTFATKADNFLSFGLPAQDIGKQTHKKGTKTSMFPPSKIFPVDDNLINVNDLSSTEHKQAFTWANQLGTCKRVLPQIQSQFPEDWFTFVLKQTSIGQSSDTTQDKILLKLCKDVVMSCFAVVNMLGLHGTIQNAGASHIHRVYHGNIPWSPELDLLEHDSELKQLVIEAFRYAFKLTYDEAVFGRIDNDEELLENLNDYKQNWFIGTEDKSGWNEAVAQEKPYLFTIGYDHENASYTSHILTKQELVLYTGTLNSAAICGQWASLAMELLYLTNDDEERYSIQAHPVLLRNLTIQAADPPLGYAVYSSGPMHIQYGLL